jgi:hypothetical protein
MVFSSASVVGVADYQNRLASIADAGRSVQRPMDVTSTANEGDSSHNGAARAAKSDLRVGALTTLQNERQTLGIPCLYGVFGGDSSQGSLEVNECTERPDEQRRFSIQLDRHIGTGRGILGDVGGVHVNYHLTPGLTLNGVAGSPVLSASDKFDITRRAFGISADLTNFAGSWDLNSYLIQQHDHRGPPAGRAVGGALRYLQTRRSLLFYADYDFVEESRTAFMASATWMPASDTSIIATLDIRNSPIQKRQQNYLQQSMVSAKGWNWMLPSNRINQLIKDRAGGVGTLALGLSHAFSKRLTLGGDVALIDGANNDKESHGRSLQAPFEYFSHLKLNAKNLMGSGDSSVFDLRHRSTDSSQVSSASIHTRYDINRCWSVNPRFSADYSSKGHNNSVSRVRSSAVKIQYRWKRKGTLQFKLGGKWLSEDTPDTQKDYSTYFLDLGYQTKF